MMARKGSFENQYESFESGSPSSILNELKNGLSDRFQTKLDNFLTAKLVLLTGNMECDIFHDGTVYTGSSGLALYYFISSQKQDNALAMLKKSSEYINLEQLKGKRISFLCGDAGPLAIATVVSSKLGCKRPSNLPEYKSIALRLMSLGSVVDDSPDELLYGKAGYLYALLFVNKYLTGKDAIPASHIEKVVASIIKSGKLLAAKMKAECPLMWEWHDKVYLGAAHGMAGILYMLLQARVHISTMEMRNLIKPTIDWLLSQQYPSGNFPSSLSSNSGDRLVQWCHGAPGFIPLCIYSSQLFEDDRYLKMAIQLGDLVWDRGLTTKGYSLCHGVSGNAYTFIQLYQATKNPLQLHRAACFTEWCALERPGTELHRPDRPASLFEGILGRLYLAQDLLRVPDARFPAFCL